MSARPPAVTQDASRWAAAAPLLCAVHCLAAPVALSLAPALDPGEPFERLLKAASVALAIYFLVQGMRVHRRAAVLLPVLAGIALWLLPEIAPAFAPIEWLVSAAGGLLLAGGMLWNGRLRHLAHCRSCGCPAWAPEASDSARK